MLNSGYDRDHDQQCNCVYNATATETLKRFFASSLLARQSWPMRTNYLQARYVTNIYSYIQRNIIRYHRADKHPLRVELRHERSMNALKSKQRDANDIAQSTAG